MSHDASAAWDGLGCIHFSHRFYRTQKAVGTGGQWSMSDDSPYERDAAQTPRRLLATRTYAQPRLPNEINETSETEISAYCRQRKHALDAPRIGSAKHPELEKLREGYPTASTKRFLVMCGCPPCPPTLSSDESNAAMAGRTCSLHRARRTTTQKRRM